MDEKNNFKRTGLLERLTNDKKAPHLFAKQLNLWKHKFIDSSYKTFQLRDMQVVCVMHTTLI